MTSGRSVALDVVASIREHDSYSNLVVPSAIREAALTARDSGHVTDLVYGSLRWRALLDAILERCVTGSIDRVDDEVRDLLRLAVYELVVRMDPPHIINEWVNLANRRFRRAAGFVNATLRAVTRRAPDEWRAVVTEGLSGNDARAVIQSHPTWIVDAYSTLVSDTELDSLLAANNEPARPTLIALPGLAKRAVGVDATQYSPYGFHSTGGSLNDVPGVREGIVRVQDEGSQLAALALVAVNPVRTGEKWLDLCAGPGGKTALLAAIGLPAGALIEANEMQPHRAELVRASLSPFDGRVPVHVRDGRTFCAEHPNTFDRIMVDAPCTGLGALRRRPEARWRKERSDLDTLVPLQRELLSAALTSVVVGGIVAYVTCSPLTEETVDVVGAVLADHPEVEMLDTPAIVHTVAPRLSEASRGNAVQLYPHRHGTDAMFIQLLRRTR